MARPQGQLERVLTGMTVGLLDDKAAREKALDQAAAHETEQQLRVGIGGAIGNGWSHSDKDVRWTLPFIWAPAQREAPYRTPHFSYGVEHLSGQTELVIVHAHVLRWITNDSSLVEGARIRFAATAPNFTGGAEGLNFSAVAHLTFQGYAAETEEGEEA